MKKVQYNTINKMDKINGKTTNHPPSPVTIEWKTRPKPRKYFVNIDRFTTPTTVYFCKGKLDHIQQYELTSVTQINDYKSYKHY